MKIVCDTNILISALIFPGGPPEQVLNLARIKEVVLCLSPDILTEFKKVLMEKFKYNGSEADEFMDRMTAIAQIVYPRERIHLITRMEADNRILECALESEADFLISGDKKDILPLKTIGKTVIATARQFLDYWKKQ